jgi:hypothetical protein
LIGRSGCVPAGLGFDSSHPRQNIMAFRQVETNDTLIAR